MAALVGKKETARNQDTGAVKTDCVYRVDAVVPYSDSTVANVSMFPEGHHFGLQFCNYIG